MWEAAGIWCLTGEWNNTCMATQQHREEECTSLCRRSHVQSYSRHLIEADVWRRFDTLLCVPFPSFAASVPSPCCLFPSIWSFYLCCVPSRSSQRQTCTHTKISHLLSPWSKCQRQLPGGPTVNCWRQAVQASNTHVQYHKLICLLHDWGWAC